MAKATRNTKSATTGRKVGRPTKAEQTARIQSQQTMLIDVAVAAASAAVKSALGIDTGTVAAIGSVAQTAGTQASPSPQAKAPASSTSRATGKRPGRSVDPNSKMSQTRVFFNANKTKMERSALVKAAAEKFGYTPQTANTYIVNIAREEGFRFPTSREPRNSTAKRTGTNG